MASFLRSLTDTGFPISKFSLFAVTSYFDLTHDSIVSHRLTALIEPKFDKVTTLDYDQSAELCCLVLVCLDSQMGTFSLKGVDIVSMYLWIKSSCFNELFDSSIYCRQSFPSIISSVHLVPAQSQSQSAPVSVTYQLWTLAVSHFTRRHSLASHGRVTTSCFLERPNHGHGNEKPSSPPHLNVRVAPMDQTAGPPSGYFSSPSTASLAPTEAVAL
jgi:hypothetical protein